MKFLLLLTLVLGTAFADTKKETKLQKKTDLVFKDGTTAYNFHSLKFVNDEITVVCGRKSKFFMDMSYVYTKDCSNGLATRLCKKSKYNECQVVANKINRSKGVTYSMTTVRGITSKK